MIKRTLLFTNPAYLSTKQKQLVIKYPEVDEKAQTVPIEDIGLVLLENQQITITNGVLEKLLDNNVALINCNAKHMPFGLFLPLVGHTSMSERIKHQINASEPLKKNLWQQTVAAKIRNQAILLNNIGVPIDNMMHWAKEVKSGDVRNHESRAAVYFWGNLFDDENFRRERHGEAPNNLLNYGYAILRAICARALVSSGLMPILGIHHRNKYNPYCLADDIMEPYRPIVDNLVLDIYEKNAMIEKLTTDIKKELLQIPVLDVEIDGKRSPLMIAMSRTTSSLFECYAQHSRKILYPTLTF